MLPGAASPWRVTDPRRRVPRARQTAPRRNGAACYSAAPELVRLDEGPAGGLPGGVVAVERRERAATSPGLGPTPAEVFS